MSLDNPFWGAPLIHGELLKLGYDVCETTIAKYMVRRPGPPAQTWHTFIRNHMAEIGAVDLSTMPTATFRTLYVFLVPSLDRRRVVHFNVTAGPTADWTSLQLIQAFPFDSAPRHLIRDRDGVYGQNVVDTLQTLNIEQIVTAPRSPWQNGYCERVIGTIRPECFDQVIVLGEGHLWRVLKEYLAYYHGSRAHLGLEKDAPELPLPKIRVPDGIPRPYPATKAPDGILGRDRNAEGSFSPWPAMLDNLTLAGIAAAAPAETSS
jgi:transposase InsO family protein